MLLFSKIFSVRRSILILVILQFVPARPGGNWEFSSDLSLPQHWKDKLKDEIKSLPGDYTNEYKMIITNLITGKMYSRGIYFLKVGYNSAKPLLEKITSNTRTNEPARHSWDYIMSYPLHALLLLSDSKEGYFNLMGKTLQSIDGKLELWLKSSEDYEPGQKSFQKEEDYLKEWEKQLDRIWEEDMKLRTTESFKEPDLKDLGNRASELVTLQKKISPFLQNNIEDLVECMVKQLAKTGLTESEYKMVFGGVNGGVKLKMKFLKQSMKLRNAEIEEYVKMFGDYGLEKFRKVKNQQFETELYDAVKKATNRAYNTVS